MRKKMPDKKKKIKEQVKKDIEQTRIRMALIAGAIY